MDGNAGIPLDELIPVANSSATGHTPILGAIVGMFVTALSLWLLK